MRHEWHCPVSYVWRPQRRGQYRKLSPNKWPPTNDCDDDDDELPRQPDSSARNMVPNLVVRYD